MRKICIFALFVAVVLLSAACGSSGPEPVQFTVAGQDNFIYDPAALSVETGAQVTISFRNEGVVQHSWVLIPNDVEPEAATQDDAVVPGARSGILDGGETETFTFTAPEPGTYQYVCTVPGHAAAGKIGELTVTGN